jgi:hypothetical protein
MARHQESWAAKGLILQRTIDLYSHRKQEVKTFARTGDRKESPLQVVGGEAAFAGANTFSPQVTDGSIARNIIHTFFS